LWENYSVFAMSNFNSKKIFGFSYVLGYKLLFEILLNLPDATYITSSQKNIINMNSQYNCTRRPTLNKIRMIWITPPKIKCTNHSAKLVKPSQRTLFETIHCLLELAHDSLPWATYLEVAPYKLLLKDHRTRRHFSHPTETWTTSSSRQWRKWYEWK